MADEARSRLGRGLASLIGDVGGEAAHVDRPRAQRKVPIEFLKPNPRNPRRTPNSVSCPARSGSTA
jgi:ParB family transcriptional regulator, chromosome partitioning protein